MQLNVTIGQYWTKDTMCMTMGYDKKQEAMTQREHQNDTCEFVVRPKISFSRNIVILFK